MDEERRVDWDVVDDELYQIPAVYKDARFDSLRHVLTVLGAVDSEAALDELRQQFVTVDGLVDDVVATYHNGFNKAIHNYSQILQLFADTKAQVETVKRNMEDAKRRLGTTSRSMQQQWRRSVTLDQTCALLADVQTLVDIPPRIQKLEEAEDWTAAAVLLLDGCNRLARQEMSKIGALRDIKKDMGVRRNVLLKAVIEELERRIYYTAIGEASDSSSDEDETPELSAALVMDEVPALPGAPEAPPARSRQSTVLDSRRSMLIANRRSQMLDARKSGMVIGRSSSAKDRARHSTVLDMRRTASANSVRGMQRPGVRGSANLSSRPASRLGAGSVPPNSSRTSTRQLSRTSSGERRRSSLVIGRRPSQVQFGRPGAAAAAAAAGKAGAGTGGSAADGAKGPEGGAAAIPLPALVDALISIGGVSETALSIRRHAATQMHNVIMRAVEAVEPAPQIEDSHGAADMEEVTVAAQAALQHAFEECQQVLRNMVAVMRLLAVSKAAPASAGLNLLLTQRREQGIRVAEAHLSHQQARVEVEVAWECMQKEVQRLLTELLGASASSSHAASGIGWQPGRNGVMAPRDGGKLTFSFDAESAGGIGAGTLQRDQSVRFSDDLGAMLMKALGGQAGSADLTPIIYRPIVAFTDAVSQLLDEMWEGEQDYSERPAVAGEAAPTMGLRQLRVFVDTFVQEEFLPEVYVDFRGRCTKMLEDPEAFQPRARLRGAAGQQPDPDAADRPLLPAALAADRMLSSLLLWAAHLQPFAIHLVGVAESVLARLLDAFQAHMNSALSGSAVQMLVNNPALARVMAAEPAANLAGDPVAFFAGRPGDSIDAFVTEVVNAGFAGGDEAAEAEVLARLLQERGVPPEALLSAGSDSGPRLAALGALSDSLDFVADAIVRFGERRHQDNSQLQDAYLGRGRGGGEGTGLTEGLAHLLDRFRASAGMAVRALRLELTLLLVFHIQDLARSSYVCEEGEATEVDECIGAFNRAATRAEEELSPYLPPNKRAYVFGSLAAQAARLVMWLLPELKEINAGGVARMVRQLTVLQPGLAAAGAAGGAFRPEAIRAFERARTYYSLLTYSADSLVKVAADRPGRFTPSEYLALLQVTVPDRYVSSEHRSQLQRIVAPAGSRPSSGLNAFKAMRIS